MILTLKINFRAKLHETHIVVFYDGRDVTKIVLICIVISGLEFDKVEKISKGSLDSIPSLSVKIQIMGRKICLRCKGKTLLGIVNKPLKTKSLLTSPGNVLPFTSSKFSHSKI